MKNELDRYNGNSIDLLKFLLSFIVVAIHVNPFGEKLGYLRFPLCRIAVPIFFLVSSYFFFRKIKNNPTNEHKNILKNLIVRNLKLYLTWFILLLPITLLSKDYFKNGLRLGISKLITDFFFSSTFKVSWYIMGLIIGISIMFLLSKVFKNHIIILLGLISFLLCSALSNYYSFAINISCVEYIYNIYPSVIYNSFPASLLWIEIGKVLVDNDSKINLKLSYLKIGIVISMVLLFLESALINYLNCSKSNDCYIMLIPVCVFIFIYVLKTNKSIKYGKIMRNMSTIIYCLHFSLKIAILNIIPLSIKGLKSSLLFYVLICMICVVFSLLVLKLSHYKAFKKLKNLY